MHVTVRRKALLIGIIYDESDNKLVGPHHDVIALRDLLVGRGYEPKDITVMIDQKDWPEHLIPTRDNILCELDNLVKDACPGDRFVLHYSGHSEQVDQSPEDPVKELDLKDEAIQTVDGLRIIDNELHQRLVTPLPPGSHLIAVFDTCHSGSLLDLYHRKCNSKKFLSIHEKRNIKTAQSVSSKTHVGLRHAEPHVKSPEIVVQTWTSKKQKRYMSRRPFFPDHPSFRQRALHNLDALLHRHQEPLEPSPSIETVLEGSRDSNLRASPIPWAPHTYRPGLEAPLKSLLSHTTELLQHVSYASNTSSSSTPSSPPRKRFSDASSITSYPEKGFVYNECLGDDCQYVDSPIDGPDVIAFSSSKDSQTSLEDPDGMSLTMIWVEILKKEKRPQLKDMIEEIAQKFSDMSNKAFESHRKWEKRRKPEDHERCDTILLHKQLKQLPQISSTRPRRTHDWVEL